MMMQNSSDYYDLIDKVAKIDINAAGYLRNAAINLESFVYDARLLNCFIWDSTPQGFDYWDNIHIQLEQFYELED